MSNHFNFRDVLSDDIREKLKENEIRQIERRLRDEVTVREEVTSDLRTENLKLRQEKDALERRVTTIEQERIELQDRLEALETDQLQFEPESVIADFGSAIKETEAEADYAITDFQADIRTRLVTTGEGVRLQFPTGVDDKSNLSSLSFGIRPKPDTDTTDYREIPDVEGLDLDTAERRIQEVGLAVGQKTTEPADTDDVVIRQFPDPYMLAEPGTEVDLTVSVVEDPSEPGPAVDPNQPNRASVDLQVINGIGARRSEYLEQGGIDTIPMLLDAEPDRIADLADVSVKQAKSWQMQAKELR